MNLHRRALFRGLLGAGALAGLGGGASRIFAAPPAEHRFVVLYFNGGWDVLLGPDPRDPARSYAGIDLGTELLPEAYRDPLPVTLGGRETLWGASMRRLVERGHHQLCTTFRSVNMNTVAHPAGRAYVNTFRSPAGAQARGSSIGTLLATAGPLSESLVMPNVSISLPTFNDAHPADFTGIRTALAPGIIDLLQPQAERLDDDVEALLARAQDEARSCVGATYRGRPEDQLRESRRRARQLERENVARFFDLGADTSEMASLRARYGLGATTHRSNPRHPGVVAAITAQLLRTGLARSVTAQLQVGMDTHRADWGSAQGPRQRLGFDALAALLDDLREDDPSLERTTVVVMSEFARTPRINGNRGRDHWFANSFLVFGGLLRPGVVGATHPESLGLQRTNLETGLPDPEGEMLQPEHIGATLAAALGLDHDAFRVSPLHAWIA